MGSVPRNFLLLSCGLLLLAIVAYDMYSWIQITQQQDTFELAKHTYLNRFPATFRNARIITFVEVVALILAITSFYQVKKRGFFQITSTIALIISAALAAWLVFSLM